MDLGNCFTIETFFFPPNVNVILKIKDNDFLGLKFFTKFIVGASVRTVSMISLLFSTEFLLHTHGHT